MRRRNGSVALVLALVLAISGVMTAFSPALASDSDKVRIKDIVRVGGVRDNQILGYGLVVGLAGTGDSRSSVFTTQAVSNMLERLGITVPPEQLRTRNVAAVMVIADLPPFVRPGDRIDVVVSSVGDARSLAGGTLLMTPLMAANGQVYAVAQGPLSIGASPSERGKLEGAHPTVARIPGGAIVEREVAMGVMRDDGTIELVLSNPDFTTAARIQQAINEKFGEAAARAIDAAKILVKVPDSLAADPVSFLAAVGDLEVVPGTKAVVVFNERTGTVVAGGDIRISPITVSQGELRIVIGAGEGDATVERLVKALTEAGARPADIIAVLQALKEAGALHSEIKVM